MFTPLMEPAFPEEQALPSTPSAVGVPWPSYPHDELMSASSVGIDRRALERVLDRFVAQLDRGLLAYDHSRRTHR